MAKGFENINACSVGNFEENTTRIPKWIVNNGGQYSKQVSKETTHLIVTEEAFAKNVTAGKLLGLPSTKPMGS
jgi:NAD-dependent DNA ligase